jgi:acetate kinase
MAIEQLFSQVVEKCEESSLAAIGHRVVHGGPKYHLPTKIDREMLRELRQISPFDPEHLPEEIHLAEAFHKRFATVPQAACFDTAFTHAMPRVATVLPIPLHYEEMGVRRYGFHGLSYSYLLEELAKSEGEAAGHGRIIMAHLGSGASLAAAHKGKPIDTTMGFSPAGGIPMSTRSGDIDPSLFWYLKCSEGMDGKQFNEIVNKKSGLLGLSQKSADMQTLLEVESQDSRAAFAVSLFCYQVKKQIGAYAAALGGLDRLIFTAGIGENSSKIRSRICEGLQYLGIELDDELNKKHENIISTSPVIVQVMHTNEALMIAKGVKEVIK